MQAQTFYLVQGFRGKVGFATMRTTDYGNAFDDTQFLARTIGTIHFTNRSPAFPTIISSHRKFILIIESKCIHCDYNEPAGRTKFYYYLARLSG